MHKLSILLLLAAGVHGQTITRQILTNSQSTTPSAAVRNVGQTVHLFFVSLSNAPSQTCTQGSPFQLQPEASFDNTNWFSIGPPITTIVADSSGNLTTVRQYTGTFSYVRFNPVSFQTVTCLLNVWYTGSPSGSIGSQSSTQLGYQSFFVNDSTLGNTVVVNPGSNSLRVVLYGYLVYNYGAAVASGFVLQCQTAGGASSLVILAPNVFTAGQALAAGFGPVPMATCNMGDRIGFTLGSAGTVSVALVYRLE